MLGENIYTTNDRQRTNILNTHTATAQKKINSIEKWVKNTNWQFK